MTFGFYATLAGSFTAPVTVCTNCAYPVT